MGSTLTIRNLDEAVKKKLRLRAASHQRSMEAEAREILARALEQPYVEETKEQRIKRIETIAGKWKDRGSTDDLMKLTRGED